MSRETDLADVIRAALDLDDPLALRVVQGIAESKAENRRLRDENAWLERRIAGPDISAAPTTP